MTQVTRFIRSAVVLSLATGLTGCFALPFDPLGPVPQAQYQGALICSPEDGTPTGNLSKDLVGTWQDWATGSYQVTRFQADGRVTVTSTPDPLAPATTTAVAAAVVGGQYTVTETSLQIAWDDGKTDTLDAALEVIPGCTMVHLKPRDGSTVRITNASELERVSCPDSAGTQGATPAKK